MTTTETSRRTTVNTIVTFDFADEGYGEVTVDIPHLNPSDEAAIQLGIKNRAETELAKLQGEG